MATDGYPFLSPTEGITLSYTRPTYNSFGQTKSIKGNASPGTHRIFYQRCGIEQDANRNLLYPNNITLLSVLKKMSRGFAYILLAIVLLSHVSSSSAFTAGSRRPDFRKGNRSRADARKLADDKQVCGPMFSQFEWNLGLSSVQKATSFREIWSK